MVTFTFFKQTKIIQVDSPDTIVTIQEIVNAVRPYEALPANIDFPKMMNGTGKDCLGALGETAPTLTLLNCWRLKFEDRSGPCFTPTFVLAGNFLAVNAFCNTPIANTAFVNTTIAQAQTATVSTEISTDMSKVRRYLTNKKLIVGTTLSIRNDGDTADDQSYTLDDSDDPKSQTPI